MEIKIKIEAPGLEKAMLTLAEALSGGINLPTAPITAPPITEGEQAGGWVPGGGEVEVEQPKKETPKKETPKKDKPKKEEKPSSGLTFEQVRVKLAEVSQKGKQKELKALITSLGAEKLSDIPEEKYAELLEKASEL